ncbi:ATP-grasp domain-containing protein, partial [Acinetobacter baumannii]|uniref:ATP-grasp domain-containing protein n=1 Tax=Acinetobacter baumannii TaxID=470 RepID=UPI00209021BC
QAQLQLRMGGAERAEGAAEQAEVLLCRQPADVQGAFAELGSVPCILEGFVPFTGEVSLVAVRARDGETRFYPLVH